MIGRYTSLMSKLPPRMGRFCKWALVYPRFWVQKRSARKGFARYGEQYSHHILFVAGMPKSGSTWLENMVASYPGYQEVLLPEATFAELKGTMGHVFQLPRGCFEGFKDCLVMTKMHCPGSLRNVEELRDAEIPYAILYRDPRDVAVSYFYYVRATPWHDDFAALKDQDTKGGIDYFIENRLPEFAEWMRSWRQNRDPGSSVMLSYEEMLEDPESAIGRVFELFDLEHDPGLVSRIVEENRFESNRGAGSEGSFFRKGRSGDWVNHFDEALREKFKRVAGGLLQEFGYESSDEW